MRAGVIKPSLSEKYGHRTSKNSISQHIVNTIKDLDAPVHPRASQVPGDERNAPISSVVFKDLYHLLDQGIVTPKPKWRAPPQREANYSNLIESPPRFGRYKKSCFKFKGLANILHLGKFLFEVKRGKGPKKQRA